MKKDPVSLNQSLLDDPLLSFPLFSGLKEIKEEVLSPPFKALSDPEQQHRVSFLLCQKIQAYPTPCFLLPAVLKFIEEIHDLNVLESYQFLHFELWLNQFSGLPPEENYQVRGKIAGKFLPRSEYQIFFPIGMGKTYAGTHYVTAHGSPDLDTTVASFWGFIDAFASRVGDHLHIWNVPGGAPQSHVEVALLFQKMFSQEIFRSLAKTKTALSLSSLDLMNQKGVLRQSIGGSLKKVDFEGAHHAVILVGERGTYLGDFRPSDVEGIRGVVSLLGECLRSFAGHFYTEIIRLLGKKNVALSDFTAWVDQLVQLPLKEALPLKEFSAKQRKHLEQYLMEVLGVKKGLESSFQEFSLNLNVPTFKYFLDALKQFASSSLFQSSGLLSEQRSEVFLSVEKLVLSLEKAMHDVREEVDRLEVAQKIKKSVFGGEIKGINYRAEIEEIKEEMGDLSYLTVTTMGRDGSLQPLGVIHAGDLHRSSLGTVSLRDFCNKEETKIPPYFEVISIIDHHKSSLQTQGASLIRIADAQSSNVLCAELSFIINDRYSVNGMPEKEISKQIENTQFSSFGERRTFQRLLQRDLNARQRGSFFVAPEREYAEYLHFLYAILDDTDLLSKVTARDVECIASLLNRLKSLSLKKEVEVISFEDLPQDERFPKKAAERILKNPEMKALYLTVYAAKEKGVEEHVRLAAEGGPSPLFLDVKVQNKCARVGQIKIFPCNISSFEKQESMLRTRWAGEALHFWKEHPDVDLHIQMISTVSGTEGVLEADPLSHSHQDALWIWIPFSEISIEHLKRFLSHFQSAPQLKDNPLSIEFCGEKASEYAELFQESFSHPFKPILQVKKAPSLVIIRYKAGTLNSRKSGISPHLPVL